MKHKHLFGRMPLVALFLALSSSALASSTWYVNGVSGSDSNNCQTPQTACKTIGHAISLASSGDSIVVAAATYKENLTINFSLKILGSSSTTTIIDGGRLRGNLVTVSSASAYVTLSRVTVRHGGGVGGGGGIVSYGTLTINNSTISGNSAEQGGGIENAGTLTINNSTVSRNTATGTDGYDAYGGGIYNGQSSSLTINNSTLNGNTVTSEYVYGGAIYNEGGVLVINNSTMSGNRARGTSCGGAICNDYYGMVALNNSTLSGNSASGGNGGGVGGFPAVFQNSILANNHPGGNCGDAYRMRSNGYNLSSDTTCHFHNAGDLNNTDPELGRLQNNGGPTQTMALPAGSPAIDAGNPSGCTDNRRHLLKTDQRGYPRPGPHDHHGCDMGAFENQKH